ncbi:Lrp/AsnC family transcriptional regulator [Candidatus Woesearchaeota archaeon]|nr:Lrp/AsnC family transcriptional regulator [Candidatus Woesearchaeota archaeon]
MHKIDKLDWKILQVLDWKAREPMKRIAKTVRSNKDVVAYRIKKLEEKGIIQGYYPVLDMNKLGYHASRFYFDLNEMNDETEKEFIRFLDKDLHAALIFKTEYHFHRYGIFVWKKSLYDAEDVIIKIKRKIGRILNSYTYSFIHTQKQYPKDYLFGKKHHDKSITLAPTQKVNYDKEDYKIIKEMAKNARASTMQIAKKTGIPQTTVSYKIKAMERKKIIRGYRALIDFIKLGYRNYFLEIYLDTNDNMEKIEAWLEAHANVVYIQRALGVCDIETEVEMRSKQELHDFLNELKTKYPNVRKVLIKSEVYMKLTFLPGED